MESNGKTETPLNDGTGTVKEIEGKNYLQISSLGWVSTDEGGKATEVTCKLVVEAASAKDGQWTIKSPADVKAVVETKVRK